MDGQYHLGSADKVLRSWCDMTSLDGGWTLVYLLCNDGGGSPRALELSHPDPLLPGRNQEVSSRTYQDVLAMDPETVRFTSDFTGGVGYVYPWSKATAGHNPMRVLLDGLMPQAADSVEDLGPPLPGSSGSDCARYIGHTNHGDGEGIPSISCNATLATPPDGLKWGQMRAADAIVGPVEPSSGDAMGVVHIGEGGWLQKDRDEHGCLNVYIRSNAQW